MTRPPDPRNGAPDTTTSGMWPKGEPKSVRDAADEKSQTR